MCIIHKIIYFLVNKKVTNGICGLLIMRLEFTAYHNVIVHSLRDVKRDPTKNSLLFESTLSAKSHLYSSARSSSSFIYMCIHGRVYRCIYTHTHTHINRAAISVLARQAQRSSARALKHDIKTPIKQLRRLGN